MTSATIPVQPASLGLDSRLKVSLILFFHENPDSVGTPPSIAMWLGTPPPDTAKALSEMADAGLLIRHGPLDAPVYSFSPPKDTLETIQAFLNNYRHAKQIIEDELAQLEKEKARIESQLQELELSLGVIADSMGEGLLVTDSHAVIRLANPIARRWLALESLVPGTSLWGLSLPDSLASVVRQGLAPSQSPLTTQLTLGDDQSRTYQATVTPIVSNSAGVLGTVTVLTDVTPFKELDQMKTDLVSFVSHQLKTPLAVVKGYASTLRRKDIDIDPAEREQFLTVIDSQADRLAGLVASFLDLTRIEAGLPLDFKPKQLLLEPFLRRLLADQEMLLSSHQVNLEVQEDLSAWVDADKLEQVLINLLTNAVKYSEPATNITISAFPRDQHAAISVTDQGEGLSPDEIANLFHRFSRAPGARSKGTGMGLYINKRLLEAQGGRIQVQSEKHRGSTFTVLLPLERTK